MSENNNMEQEQDLNQLMIVRRDKLNKLKEEGKDPYKITKFIVSPLLYLLKKPYYTIIVRLG